MMGRLMLAPMEGLVDDVMRDILTRASTYDYSVTEFARVTHTRLPASFFTRISPELLNGGRTAAGVPVKVQLLGSDPEAMARSAATLVVLQPPGVDLNFGCPAPTVNRHRGGAVLLDEPEVLYAIASAVRAVVPRSIPFSAKMRLGVRDPSRALECAQALAAGGIDELVVHARTKLDQYRPPAYWRELVPLAEALAIPVVANGEVWTVADWQRCRAESGCADVMLGRGAVADPFLAQRIRAPHNCRDEAALWQALLPLVGRFWWRVRAKVEARHAPGRLKQWLHLLERAYPPAARLLAELRALRTVAEIEIVMARHGVPAWKQAA